MLVGDYPNLEQLRDEKSIFGALVWQKYSKSVKNLLNKLLTYKAQQRCTIDQFLHDAWFAQVHKSKKHSSEVLESDKQIIRSLCAFQNDSFFKTSVINTLVKMADQNEVAQITQDFKKIDTDGSGTIDKQELKAFLRAKRCILTDEQVDIMMERLDFVAGADGQINFSEFLAANLDLTKLMTEDRLKAIF